MCGTLRDMIADNSTGNTVPIPLPAQIIQEVDLYCRQQPESPRWTDLGMITQVGC